MLELSALKNGTKMESNKFLETWMDTNLSWEERLARGVSNIINSLWIVRATWNNTPILITWDGTLKSVFRGMNLSSTARKTGTTFTLEIPLKKENIHGLNLEVPCHCGNPSSVALCIKTIEKSPTGVINGEVEAKVLWCTFLHVEENCFLFLDVNVTLNASWTISR